jgi:TPR repeat protein
MTPRSDHRSRDRASSGWPGQTLAALGLATLLLAAGSAQAGPREDTDRAEAALRGGDLITALALFKQAADAGHAPAQARMGDLMDAAEQNADAVAWYRKAAEQGEPAGEYGLARMAAVGKGLPRDAAQALQWLRQAVQKQHAPAIEALARAHRAGDLGLPKDPAEAARLEAQAKALRDQQSAAARRSTPP